MKKTLEINWGQLLLIPFWVIAFIKTYDTPTFWVILILVVKDIKITTKHENY